MHYLLLLCLVFLSACAGTQKADYQTPLSIPRDAQTPPLYFSGMKIDLPKGEDVGVLSHSNRLCGIPYQPVGSNILRGQVSKSDLQDVFENALEPLGYDVVSAPESFFFEEEAQDEVLRTEYKIGAKLVDLDVVACGQDAEFGFFGFQRDGVKGEMLATYEWSVFDNIRKTTVYKVRTEGYAKRASVHRNGMSLLLEDTFEMAAHNLGSDQGFYQLMVNGIVPKQEEDTVERCCFSDPGEDVFVSLKQSPSLDLQRAQKGTVLVEGGMGHGSGFFITQEGHILTNAHVVGKARRVRIVTSGKQEKLAAEVLRVDSVRDVALLRLETLPESLHIPISYFRTDWPEVGEEVYVIGTPLSTKLQDTVTKGIISAHRRDFKIFGASVDILQADVAVQGGNSGGPLLDKQGNIAGIAVAGVGATNQALNYFIPVNSAFQALQIESRGPRF